MMAGAGFPQTRGIDQTARRVTRLTGRGILRRIAAASPFLRFAAAMGPAEVTIQASQAPGAPPRQRPADAISLHGVHKNFGAVQAVRGLDLSIGHGEVVAFLGPNGAGKTTTIDMILGLSQPTSG
jgi:ABC-type glutathione transport system ATPase component